MRAADTFIMTTWESGMLSSTAEQNSDPITAVSHPESELSVEIHLSNMKTVVPALQWHQM